MSDASDDCLFCRIVAGDVPSARVDSTDTIYAFRDIEPVAPVHVLVVPKRHLADATARRVAEREGIAESGYRLAFNVGEDAVNSVPHLHLHVMGGRRMGWPPG
jgi:histidine triad (HIT) family protein